MLRRDVRFLGTAEQYVASQLALGRSRQEVLDEVAAFAALRARGDDEPDGTVRRLTGRDPTTFEAYAEAAAARGAWARNG